VKEEAMQAQKSPVVHLELHTQNLPRACDFYTHLFGWRTQTVNLLSGAYQALELGREIAGGVVECETPHSMWLPYVEVEKIGNATETARELGARVLLSPREGPAGWRSVISEPSGAEIALWQPKG
jgi:predicted enzyme related to lactoylglutathione lyase